MEDITTEKKLQLVQQIRTQHNQNQYDMSNRERILYGKALSYHEDRLTTNNNAEEAKVATESLKLRCVLAAMLFLFAIVFDLLGVKPGGMEMQDIFQAIAEDYQENMKEFVNVMTEETILSE